jgi:hypothetical protein
VSAGNGPTRVPGLRLRLGDLLVAGGRTVSKYLGTVLSVFLAQAFVALACMLAIAVVLAQAFSHLPMFDEAVDGDLVAIIYCLTWGKPSFLAIGGIVFGALLLWQLVSWFVVGGLLGVVARGPEGRADTARVFGASGAATYLSYAKLALCQIPVWIVILFAFGFGWRLVEDQLEHALTVPQLIGPLVLASLPAVLLLHVAWTVADYARVELTLRHETHDPSVIATYVRTIAYVARRPLTLVHGALGWLAIFVVTVAYAYLAQGHPMYGADGAVMLFFVRQGVALLRMVIRVAVLAGQVELGRTRPLPPRRSVAGTADTKP